MDAARRGRDLPALRAAAASTLQAVSGAFPDFADSAMAVPVRRPRRLSTRASGDRCLAL